MRCEKCGGYTMNTVYGGVPVCLFCAGQRVMVPDQSAVQRDDERIMTRREVTFVASYQGQPIASRSFSVLDSAGTQRMIDYERVKDNIKVTGGEADV